MNARASCPFTSRSGPIADHSVCGPIVAALTYGQRTAREGRHLPPLSSVVQLLPAPRQRGVRDQRGMEATSGTA